MKILTVVVPCFNSEAYMKKCIDSLLVGGENIEIIIVNDGSTKDNTAKIADEYVENYPHIVRAVHKENGGHGSAVNMGIEKASGLYFKVVDSDDWVNPEALQKIISFLIKTEEANKPVDMVISNFIYDKQGIKNKCTMSYRNTLPVETYFNWKDVKAFKLNQYMMMHSMIYRTEILRACKLRLPHHTFYVDNIYVYFPLPYVKQMYYIDVDLYHYFIGREDQSVNERIMISRIDQQIKVNKLLFEQYDLAEVEEKRLQEYMYRYLELVTIVSRVLLIKEGSKEKLEMKKQLWMDMKKTNKNMYMKLRYGTIMGNIVHLPGKIGRKIILGIYYITQKKIGFN